MDDEEEGREMITWRWFVGISRAGRSMMFAAIGIPKKTKYPQFEKVVGPFQSEENALAYAVEYGRHRNPTSNVMVYFCTKDGEYHNSNSDIYFKHYKYQGAAPTRLKDVQRQRNPVDDSSYAFIWNKLTNTQRVNLISNDPETPVASAYHDRLWEDLSGKVRVIAKRYLRSRLSNSPVGKIIYEHIEEIRAEKGTNSLWPKEKFKHKFKRGARVIGLPNGDLLVKSTEGKRLWNNFDY